MGCGSQQGQRCWKLRPQENIYYYFYVLIHSVAGSFFSLFFLFLWLLLFILRLWEFFLKPHSLFLLYFSTTSAFCCSVLFVFFVDLFIYFFFNFAFLFFPYVSLFCVLCLVPHLAHIFRFVFFFFLYFSWFCF